MTVRVRVEAESARLKGAGVGQRIWQMAGFYDLTGVLQLAAKPADAPVIHFDGPLQVTFYGERPSLRLGRSNEFVLMVGTPGLGGGTFAMLAYEDTIPKTAYPKIAAILPPAQKGGEPVRELFELKQRC